MMRKILYIGAAACLLASGLVAAADLSLLITHDSQSLDEDGVTRTQHFQERLVRQDNTVWVERVMPPLAIQAHAAQACEEGKEHKHLDMDAATRWVTRGSDGKVQLRLVNAIEKQVVAIGPGDYDAVGFDGNWDNAWHLLDPRQLRQMKKLAKAAPAGANWYEGRQDGRYLRVLWDEGKACPLRIESGTDNGLVRREMSAVVQPAPKTLPWQALRGYAQKEYSDFLD